MQLMYITINHRNIMINRVNGTYIVYKKTVRTVFTIVNSKSVITKCRERQLSVFINHVNGLTLIFSVKSINDTIPDNDGTDGI